MTGTMPQVLPSPPGGAPGARAAGVPQSRQAEPAANRSDQLDALLDARPADHSLRGMFRSAGEGVQSLFIPHNVGKTMTPDYLPTRAWWMGREVMNNLSYGFAASQATSLALELLVKAQPGVPIATIGLGLGMYWFPKVVDQLRNATSMAASTVAPVADRRPKAWFLAGDILDNVATAVMSGAALVPGLYAPLTIGVGAAFTVAGVLKRRAQSNMFYRQAISPTDTLPEINTKESNQSIVLNLVSMAAGAGIQYALGGTGLAAALPVVGCAAAALGIFASVKFLSHLDMENINESVVRRAVERMEQGRELPEPDRRVGKLLGQLLEKDTVQLGQDLGRLKQSGSARYQQLLQLYGGDKYLLEAYKGSPYVVMKEGAGKQDSLAAAVQAIHVERLAAAPEYAERVARDGSDGADFWLVEQSLAKARQQAPGLLERLETRGWASDLVNLRDTEVRFTPEDLDRPLAPGEPALP